MFLTFDGDNIGSAVARATASDSVNEIKDVDAKIRAGANVWENWVREVGGQVIEVGGDEGRFVIPDDAASKAEGPRHQYQQATGYTCSVGIGNRISEADRALAIAKLDGKDRVVVYNSVVGDRFERLMHEERRESDKVKAAYAQPDSSASPNQPVPAGNAPQEAGGAPEQEDSNGRDDNFVSNVSFDDVKARLEQMVAAGQAPSDDLSGLRHIYEGIVSKLGDIETLRESNPRAYSLAVQALLAMRQMIRDSRGD